ncbi:MAG: DUF4332 domain-containing protein [Chloroflexi bacterium]|nr:DUF4332 domain-containing protein [Chloroflexota bacterium]
MRYLLEKFPSISASERQALAALGIADTDQLLAAAALPSRREDLARRGGISFERLTRLAGLSDLVRVKGVGPALAEALVDSGMAGNIQQLIGHASDLPALRQALLDHAEQAGLHPPHVSVAQWGEICAESRELRPRLLLNSQKPDPQFRRDLFAYAWKERKQSLKLNLGIFAAVLVPILLLMIGAWVYVNSLASKPLSPYDDINRLYTAAWLANFFLLERSLLVVAALLMGMVALLTLAYEGVNHLQATWLVLFLFSTPGQREFYQRVNALDLKKQTRALWWMVALLALMALILVGFALGAMFDESALSSGTLNNTALLAAFSWVTIPFGVLMGVVASVPVLAFLWKEFPAGSKYDRDHARRYSIYYMLKILMLPVLVVFLSQVIIPFAFSWHTAIVKDRLAPQARAAILETRQELAAVPLTDGEKPLWRDYALSVVDETILTGIDSRALIVTPEDTSAVDLIVPAALNMVVWIALTAILLLFVIPYLILGGWGRGLSYIFILWISFSLENWLTAISPTWFQLPRGGVITGLFVAVFIFINALFFDWLFDVGTQRKKVCPACKTELDRESLFCSECGFQQE